MPHWSVTPPAGFSFWGFRGESVAGTIAEMSALVFGPPVYQVTRCGPVAHTLASSPRGGAVLVHG
jgi:hypothetical protein